MVSELFNDSSLINANSNVHHAALCTDTCDLSSKDPQKWSKEKHRFKHKMICDYETSYSEKTGLWWLVYVEGEGMYCLLCRKHKVVNSNEFFCSKAATRFRKEAIVDHMKTKSHKAAELEECVQRISPFEKEIADKKQFANEVYENAFQCLYWIAKEELPNRKFVSLINLMKSLGLEKMKHFNHQGAGSIREMMITIGDVLCEDVLVELRRANTFGIMVDDVTDISNKEQCVCFAQYVDSNGFPKVQFLFVENALKNSDSVNAETIVNIIYEKIDNFGLDRKKLGSLCTDGAAVMVAKNGVAGKLKQQNPSLINIHCICHKLALACVGSTEEVKSIRQTHLYLVQLWKYFENSPKRTAIYIKVQEEMKSLTLSDQARRIVSKKLKKACATRWLSFQNSIDSVFEDIIPILNTLNILGEKDTAAYGLLQRMKGFSFISSVYILKFFLPILSTLSKTFQSGNIDFSRIGPSIAYTLDRLEEIKHEESPLKVLKEDLNNGGKLGDLFSASESQFLDAKRLLEKYIDALVHNIKQRFSDSMNILKSFDIFNPLSIPERDQREFRNYGEEHVITLTEHFFSACDETEKEEINTEWRKMKYHFLQWKKEMTLTDRETDERKLSPTQEVLQRILQRKEDFKVFFPHMVFLAEVCQSIPVSNAWPERGASVVKRLKTRFRSSLKEDMLMCLMHISINGPCFEKQNLIEKSVEKWRSEKSRKKLPGNMKKTSTEAVFLQEQQDVEIETADSSIQTDITGDIMSYEHLRNELRAAAKAFFLDKSMEESSIFNDNEKVLEDSDYSDDDM
ncbi:zinc finger protein 862-like isoform X2 [Saccostrea cucullata]